VAVGPIAKLNERLGWRKLKLAATNRRLHRDIRQRKSAEANLKKSGQQRTRLLQDSLQRQESARHRAHAMLSAQEKERHTMSRYLQDEIVQTLVGIKVRLLDLEKAAKGGPDVRKEIAITQRLVEESVQSINRFAHELDIRQPT
jgi:signal transduction histidine kinase